MPTTRLLNCKLKHLGSQANAVGPRVIQACREQRVHSLDTDGTRPGPKGIQACRRCRHTHASETGAYGTTRKFQTHRKNEKNEKMHYCASRRCTGSQLLPKACELGLYRLATFPVTLRVGVTPSRKPVGCESVLHQLASIRGTLRDGETPTRTTSVFFPVLSPVALSVELNPHPMGPCTSIDMSESPSSCVLAPCLTRP